MCITSCKQRSATHKLRMVNLWPNLTAYQSVSFFLSPFARLFIFPFATFRCGPIKKIALTARKSLCSFANGRSGFPLVTVHPLCQLRKCSRTSLLPAEIFGILISRNLRKRSKCVWVKFDNRKKSYHFREPHQSFKVFEMLWVTFLAVTITSRELMVRK